MLWRCASKLGFLCSDHTLWNLEWVKFKDSLFSVLPDSWGNPEIQSSGPRVTRLWLNYWVQSRSLLCEHPFGLSLRNIPPPSLGAALWNWRTMSTPCVLGLLGPCLAALCRGSLFKMEPGTFPGTSLSTTHKDDTELALLCVKVRQQLWGSSFLRGLVTLRTCAHP